MFRPSMLAIFRLYMKHLTICYIYTWVGGGIYILWVGVGARSRYVFVERGVDRVCLVGVVKVSFMSLSNYIYKQVKFWLEQLY